MNQTLQQRYVWPITLSLIYKASLATPTSLPRNSFTELEIFCIGSCEKYLIERFCYKPYYYIFYPNFDLFILSSTEWNTKELFLFFIISKIYISCVTSKILNLTNFLPLFKWKRTNIFIFCSMSWICDCTSFQITPRL